MDHDQRSFRVTVHPGAEGQRNPLQHLRSATEDLPGYRIDPDELLDAGDDIVVCGRISAQGRVSEARVERPYFPVYTFQAGRVRAVRIFGTRAEALEAARLQKYGDR